MSAVNFRTCNHIFANGKPCGSPAMRGLSLCYYHRRNRPRRQRELVADLHTRYGILRSLTNIFDALRTDRISTGEAGKLLYAIQTAIVTHKQAQKR